MYNTFRYYTECTCSIGESLHSYLRLLGGQFESIGYICEGSGWPDHTLQVVDRRSFLYTDLAQRETTTATCCGLLLPLKSLLYTIDEWYFRGSIQGNAPTLQGDWFYRHLSTWMLLIFLRYTLWGNVGLWSLDSALTGHFLHFKNHKVAHSQDNRQARSNQTQETNEGIVIDFDFAYCEELTQGSWIASCRRNSCTSTDLESALDSFRKLWGWLLESCMIKPKSLVPEDSFQGITLYVCLTWRSGTNMTSISHDCRYVVDLCQ